jgi:GNAT superfamily N-acetyltransferase
METVAEPMTARERDPEQLKRLFDGGWPEFIFHDQIAAAYGDRVRSHHRDLELVLLRPDTDELVAAGWAIRVRWDGTVADLPGGYADALVRGWHAIEHSTATDTMIVMAAQVRSDLNGQGLAGDLLTAFRELAADHGLPRVIAPVRPTLKPRYPLIPIAEYATWTTPDGEPFDPWVRTHTRLGAKIIGTAPESETIIGTVAEWEAWTGLRLPGSGEYVIPAGLSTVLIDKINDTGVYVEPNIWLQHA